MPHANGSNGGFDRLLAPRVHTESGSLPLIDVLSDYLANHQSIHISIHGHGSTSAARYVRQWAMQTDFPISAGVLTTTQQTGETISILAGKQHSSILEDVHFQLCNWGRDEFIEYLLAFYPDQCQRAMRFLSTINMNFAGGSPLYWQPYLEHVATHQQPLDPSEFVLETIASAAGDQLELGKPEDVAELPLCLQRWLKINEIVNLLLATRMARHIQASQRSVLKRPMSKELVVMIADRLRQQATSLAPTLRFLERASTKTRYAAAAINLLARVQPEWKPQISRSINIAGSDLQGVQWSGCQLRHVNLRKVNLREADLSSADLCYADLDECRFDCASMINIQMNRVLGMNVGFGQVDLTTATLMDCKLAVVDFTKAILRGCDFTRSQLAQVVMNAANLREANFDYSILDQVSLQDAVLSTARFRHAKFRHVQFKGASLRRADFEEAEFASGTDLELHDLSGCNFCGAILKGVYLTDSVAQDACFKLADLRMAGLAGIVWQDCDLRGADLRGAAFHMGSTRCGLVDSPYPSHGTRTGFYTDDYSDLAFKQPEQIRKAALVGCDLRGALLAGCDFYLVDVRDCRLDPEQRHQMAACGAILE